MHSQGERARDLIAELKIALIEYLRQLAQVPAVSHAREGGSEVGSWWVKHLDSASKTSPSTLELTRG